jgi:FHS family L-fucose permease-like MFS transporter
MNAQGTLVSPTRDPGRADESRPHRWPFAVMTSLFFLWGFMTVFNDILIPRFKTVFTLNYFEAMLVQFAFFGAYFIGSALYFGISVTFGDPIARIGYKNGIVLGLLISALGSALFWPASVAPSYPLFLLALFVVGLGFAMLQIAANPYVTILGPERTASSRLNLAQGFNSMGTTIGPLIGGYLIFRYFAQSGTHGAEAVKVPYLAFCIVFVLMAVVFAPIRLPHIGEGRIGKGAGALRYPHVVLGIIAIFMYVGGEVAVGSSIINFLGQKSVAGLTELAASKFVSLYWCGLLLGRFMGAVALSEMAGPKKQWLLAAIPIAGFLALWGLLGGDAVAAYGPLLAGCWLLFQVAGARANRALMIFSTTVVLLLATAVLTGGRLAMWCVVGVGLFTSIGWSNTFSLAIEGVGVFKSQASSLLVMAILGGAVLPPIQGFVADHSQLQFSYVVPLVAYAYVAFYGWKGYAVGRATERAC